MTASRLRSLVTPMIPRPLQALAWGVALLVGCLGLMRLKPEPGSHRLEQYEFETTRHLVRFVERAAQRVETEGEKVFEEFRDRKGPWFESQSSLYLFAYDTNGVCLFHPVEMALQGRNLSDLRDVHGKQMIPAIAGIPVRGWVHYCWARPGGFFPAWKSSYVVRTRTPDGKVYNLGAGLYDMQIEKAFVRHTVDSAAALLDREGDRAVGKLRDPANEFTFLDNYIFVLGMDGTAIVDPSFENAPFRNFSDFQDSNGKKPFPEIVEKLRQEDAAWIMFMWPKPGESTPSKKVAYVRKVKLGDRSVIVGTHYFQPTPIWMKGP